MQNSTKKIIDTLVVVREVGERTSQALRQLLECQVLKENIVTVSERPFPKTLLRSFELALDRKLQWTICIDGDVLVRPDAINAIKNGINDADSDLFGAQGYVLDKFFGGTRRAGFRLYRTALLRQAIDHIPFDNRSKRPETYMVKLMQGEGHGWMENEILFGLHDFEQYYRDIYRTCFFHAQKHRRYIPLLLRYWRREAMIDSDFRVAIRGAEDGLQESDVLGLDYQNFSKRSEQALIEMELSEKEEFVIDPKSEESFVVNMINTWESPPEYFELVRQMQRASSLPRRIVSGVLRKSKVRTLYRRYLQNR